MKTFKAYLKQQGEGCDYTIGCGQTVLTILADDMGSAKFKLFDIISENYSSERELSTAELYEVSDILEINLENYYNLIKDKHYNSIKQEEERLEIEELKRLRAKYGNV